MQKSIGSFFSKVCVGNKRGFDALKIKVENKSTDSDDDSEIDVVEKVKPRKRQIKAIVKTE